jgi:alpha-galactosidase
MAELKKILVRRFLVTLMLAGLRGYAADSLRIEGGNIRIEFDASMHSRVVALLGGREIPVGDFTASEFIRTAGSVVKDFSLRSHQREPVRDRLGAGFRTVITGTAPALKKVVTVTLYDGFPRMAFFDVEYTNTGAADLPVTGWANQSYAIGAARSDVEPAFWS